MSDKISFSRYEHDLLPAFRKRMSQAESTEDVRKFFNYTVDELFQLVFEGRVALEVDDLALAPEDKPHYRLAQRLTAVQEINSTMGDSDLPNVLERFAETAVHHYRHLEKHPEKTRAKIRN
jgi:hypothetical protein